MKHALTIAGALLFVAIAGYAQTSSQAPLTKEALAWFYDQPAGAGSCATQQSGLLLAARPRLIRPNSLCTATAHCSTGTVFCSGNNSVTSCSAADRNCPSEQGHVTCDGSTTWCQPVCPCGRDVCCTCDQTGDCFACCRCSGGSGPHCYLLCYGY
jgi:hypothetical protein